MFPLYTFHFNCEDGGGVSAKRMVDSHHLHMLATRLFGHITVHDKFYEPCNEDN